MSHWRFRDVDWQPRRLPRLMGILNVTPDSFSDGGRYVRLDEAIAQGVRLVEQGADILDVGGESTRPGAEPVGSDEELRRVVPVIRTLCTEVSVPISIDTTKSAVAEAAIAAGASVVNDISGLTFDPQMPQLCAEHAVGVICMHIQGTPQTMQIDPQYDDCVIEIRDWLAQRLDALAVAGIAVERIAVDPGIGFGKTALHNLQILSRVAALRALGRPVLIGHSRKRFLGKLLGLPLDERTFATVGVAVGLAAQGTDMIRVHDVAATRDALLAWDALQHPEDVWDRL